MTPDRPSVDDLAGAQLDDQDEALLDRLAQLYTAVDPLPPGALERIAFGLSLAEMEAELAEIQLHSAELAGVRTDVETVRTMSFAASTVTIVVTIGDSGADLVRIDGWLSPAAPMTVELRQLNGTRTGESDVNGRFVFADVESGLASVVVRPSGSGRPVATPTFQV